MNKLLLALSLLMSLNAMADCRPQISKRLDKVEARTSQNKANLAVGSVLGGVLTIVSAPLGITILAISTTGPVLDTMNRNQLRKLKGALDEAYAFYNESAEAGPRLKKLLRKVNRKLDTSIEMNELVNAIIESNETNNLCGSKNLNQFARRIEVELE
jgi:hypothetical protein